MLIDRYAPEDVFARVPELADQTDPVLLELDHLLDDDTLYQQVRRDLAHRYRLTPVHGRHSTPAEVLMRLLVVQHLYAWSYRETVARVTDSLVLRWFCRVYFQHVPVATTVLRWAATIQPATLQALNDRVALLAKQARVTQGRKLRLDSTCVQTALHHPTDSGLLVDGVRVLTRLIRQAKSLVTTPLAGVRDVFRSRLRTVRRTVQLLHRQSRRPSSPAQKAEQQRAIYQALLAVTRQVVRQAGRVRAARAPLLPAEPAGQESRRQLEPATRRGLRLQAQFERFLPLIEHVIAQAQSRVLEGRQVPASEKVLSLFEPHTRLVPRHKGGAAVEFGRQVMLCEVEGGIVPRYHVLAAGESDRHQAIPAVVQHRRLFGRAPRLLTGDRGVHAKGVEEQAQALGVRHVAIPRSGPSTPAQRARERDRAWRRHYRWRAGIEGRISSLRRDYGLERCPYHGEVGLERWVGWGVIASNLRRIGRQLTTHRSQPAHAG
jgi:transposase, IS5 family